MKALSLSLSLLLLGSACRSGRAPVEVTAIALQTAFLEDASAARDSFGDRTLWVSGEVLQAEPRFQGTTMSGDVTVPSRITFRTLLDSLPGDLKYVVAEGSFDVPDTLAPWTLDPRIRVGSAVRVECDGRTIRWSDPGLYLSECRLAMP